METNITVEIKTVYGNDLIYPICEKAKTFAKIAGHKTLNMTDIQNIKSLGYTVQVKSAVSL